MPSGVSKALGCPKSARSDGYERRRPEETVLYLVVREHWPRFLERAEDAGRMPRFVVRELEEYLRCGLLEHGFVHLACRACGHEMHIAFSCNPRGFCPSRSGSGVSKPASGPRLPADVLAALGVLEADRRDASVRPLRGLIHRLAPRGHTLHPVTGRRLDVDHIARVLGERGRDARAPPQPPPNRTSI